MPESSAGPTPLQLVLQPTGLTFTLNRPDLVVGRHSTADVRLPLPDVSRFHCRFRFEEGAWYVHDLNSLNGVYINGVRVTRSIVQPGDLFRLGGFTFLVDRARPDPTASAPEAA
jgi:pSer/pThr/pTyr-binding forkhead associated (FHA) protein